MLILGEILIVLFILWGIIVYAMSRPSFEIFSINTYANDGHIGIVSERYRTEMSICDVDLIYYIPKYRIAMCYRNVPPHKIMELTDKLTAKVDEYLKEMEYVDETNCFIETRDRVRNDVKGDKNYMK